jgi:hypothetical protein
MCEATSSLHAKGLLDSRNCVPIILPHQYTDHLQLVAVHGIVKGGQPRMVASIDNPATQARSPAQPQSRQRQARQQACM